VTYVSHQVCSQVVKFRTSSMLRWENKHILNFSETTSKKTAMSNSEKWKTEWKYREYSGAKWIDTWYQ